MADDRFGIRQSRGRSVPALHPSQQPQTEAFVPGGGGPASVLLHAPAKCAGLARLSLDGVGTRYWVGAYNYEDSWGDKLFFVDESLSQAKIIPVTRGLLTSQGGEFQIQPYFYKHANASASQGFLAVVVNGVDRPLVLKDARTYSGLPFSVTALDVRPSNAAVDTIPPPAPAIGSSYLVAPTCVAVYQGVLVWGGHSMATVSSDPTTVTLNRRDNFIAFSDPNRPHALAQTSNVISDIRIGDTVQEPVTALAVNSASLDSTGIKGQLVAFTTRRVTIFDGLPPITGNPVGVNFSSIALTGVGCNAPRTVVQTPAGLMFLGSDNMVYLIPIYSGSGPIAVGRAIEPALRAMTPRQQRQCSAVFFDGFYRLSYPECGQNVLGGGEIPPDIRNPQADIANRQLWADLRPLLGPTESALPRRQGLTWFGPHVGMEHYCFAVATGPGDRGEILAGSPNSGALLRPFVDSSRTDPTPGNLSVAQPIDTIAVTGPLDMGDVHVDKTITALSFGVIADRTTEVTSSLVLGGQDLEPTAATQFVEAIVPPGAEFDASDFDGANFVSGDAHRPVTERPSGRLRGRVFRIELRETSGANARIAYTDLEFRVRISGRRQ